MELLSENVDQVGVAVDLLLVDVHEVAVDLEHLRVVRVHREPYLKPGAVLLVIGRKSIHQCVFEVASFDIFSLVVDFGPRPAPAEYGTVPGSAVLINGPIIVGLLRQDGILDIP